MSFRTQATTAFAAWAVSLLIVSSVSAAEADLRVVAAAENQNREAVRALIQQRADVNATQPDGATALAWASHWNDMEMADLLIAAGADVNAANDYGVTPLALAVNNRSVAMVQKLLKAGADPNARLWTGESPLMTAAMHGEMEIAKLLVAAGADVNAVEPRRGQTALMWAIAYDHPDVARLLIENGADVRARTHRYEAEGFTPMVIRGYGGDIQATPTGGSTPLMFAARQGDLETARLLIAKGADPNEATEEDGNTLVAAAAAGYEELALFLLENGADPNASDGNGITPLHYAMRDGLKVLHGMDIEKVQRVCQNGAGGRCVAVENAASISSLEPEVLQALKAGKAVDALQYQQQPGGYDTRRTSEVLEGRNMMTLARALIAKGANVNAEIQRPPERLRLRRKPLLNLKGATPFLLASAAADLVAMRTLVEARAKPLVETVVDQKEFLKEGYGDDNQIQGNGSPFLVAAGLGRENDFGKQEEERALQVLKTLLQLGADVNEATETGWTALHAASFLGANTLIEFLVSQGAELNARNGCGQTPLTLAEGTDARGLLQRVTPHPKTAELLRTLGAVDSSPMKPVGRCVEGRFGLEYAVVKPGAKAPPKEAPKEAPGEAPDEAPQEQQ
jgi:ankyrin repeat protein